MKPVPGNPDRLNIHIYVQYVQQYWTYMRGFILIDLITELRSKVYGEVFDYQVLMDTLHENRNPVQKSGNSINSP